MITFPIVILLLIGGLVLAFIGRKHFPRQRGWVAAGPAGCALVLLAASVVSIVPDGHVAATRAFGQFGRNLSPGFNAIAPWESTVELDVRVQSFTFSSDTSDDWVSGPISSQARGGGNLDVELTVQIAPDPTGATTLLRTVGEGWFNTIVLPAVRSCVRDATVPFDLEEAYTTARTAIATSVFDCVEGRARHRGLNLIDILIRDIDPGTAVRTAIDQKQTAEQNLQRASIILLEEEVIARQEAVRAWGISEAEQIIACGGVEERNDTGEIVSVTPNAACEDQFSAEYLQWLYINALSEIDGIVIVPPEFDGQLFVNTAGS